MSFPTSSKTIIVGAGLAGASAAWHLRRAGHEVMVLDAGEEDTRATGVGGGLANPMMARKGRPTWKARESLDALESMGVGTYGAEVPGLNGREAAIIRTPIDTEQAGFFREQAEQNPDLGTFLEANKCGELDRWIDIQHGALLVHRGASLNLGQAARQWLDGQRVHRIRPEWTAEEDDDGVVLLSGEDRFRGDRLLLCMGYGMLSHPLTRSLKLHAIKGQTIRLKKPEGLPDPLLPISSAAYLVDAGDGSVWVGSTFERGWDTEGPTEEATRELLARAVQVIPALEGAPALEERTGFRVTVPGTRKPMAGPLHPGSRIHILTGFGARGLLHSAWFGARIPAFFNDPEAIPEECRVVHRSAES